MFIAYTGKHQRGGAVGHSYVCGKEAVLNFVAQNSIFQGEGQNNAKSGSL